MKAESIISHIIISVLTTGVGFFIKDLLFKQSTKIQIAALEKENENLKDRVEDQNEIIIETTHELGLIKLQLQTLDENYKELKSDMRKENEKTNIALNENTRAINKLQGTLEGLTRMLKKHEE